VKTSHDVDEVTIETVVDGVWETAEESPSQSHLDLRECLGKLGNKANDPF
jgi:hypothetical protein